MTWDIAIVAVRGAVVWVLVIVVGLRVSPWRTIWASLLGIEIRFLGTLSWALCIFGDLVVEKCSWR